MAYYSTQYANGQPMSAGQKAAATRRANRAAGIPPKSSKGTAAGTSRSVLNNYKTAAPSANALLLAALAAFEAAMKAKLSDDRRAGKLAPEAPKQFETYQKLKALALGPTTNDAMRTEAQSALRMSMTAAIKLLF